MQRSVKLSLKFATGKKRRVIAALLESYRAAVRFYLRQLWEMPPLSKKKDGGANLYHQLRSSRLGGSLKASALGQAMDIIKATRSSARVTGQEPSCPGFDHGAIVLYESRNQMRIQEGRGAFDLVAHITCLRRGEPLIVPLRKTAVWNRWASWPGSILAKSYRLTDDAIIVSFRLPSLPPKTDGRAIGVDLGVNKLISDSDGNHYGRMFKAIRDKIRRRKPGSRARRRAHGERDNYINRTVKELPWNEINKLVYEDLRNLKRGKKRGRGKNFRKALSPWTYCKVTSAIVKQAQENRVCPVSCDPRHTSQECPECGTVHKGNREGESFRCLSCGYAADADTVGARNILARTSGTPGTCCSRR